MPAISAAKGSSCLSESNNGDTKGFIGLSAGVWPGSVWNGKYVENVAEMQTVEAVHFKHAHECAQKCKRICIFVYLLEVHYYE